MGSTNLAIVITPNLVKSSNPMRDVLMCNVPTPGRTSNSFNVQLLNADPSPDLADGKCTLGIVIDLCIRRYYEIFDEVVDRSEAVAPWRALRTSQIYEGTSEGSGSPREPMYVLGDADEDDYSYDGENNAVSQQQQPVGRGPWAHQSTTYMPPHPQNGASRRQRSRQSNGGGGSRVIAAQSLFNGNANGDGPSSSSPAGQWSGTVRGGHNGKARSVVSVGELGEGALGSGTLRKGSISVGRGTTRKGSGAAVEAHGVVAEGFFTPPVGAPPVPPRPGSISTTMKPEQKCSVRAPVPTVKVEQTQDEEEPRMSVGERRWMFESGR